MSNRTLPAAIFAKLRDTVKANGGMVGCGEMFKNRNEPCCIFGHAALADKLDPRTAIEWFYTDPKRRVDFPLNTTPEVMLALEAAGISYRDNDRAVGGSALTKVTPSVTFEQWCELLDVTPEVEAAHAVSEIEDPEA